jgi:hypothetical protein
VTVRPDTRRPTRVFRASLLLNDRESLLGRMSALGHGHATPLPQYRFNLLIDRLGKCTLIALHFQTFAVRLNPTAGTRASKYTPGGVLPVADCARSRS